MEERKENGDNALCTEVINFIVSNGVKRARLLDKEFLVLEGCDRANT